MGARPSFHSQMSSSRRSARIVLLWPCLEVVHLMGTLYSGWRCSASYKSTEIADHDLKGTIRTESGSATISARVDVRRSSRVGNACCAGRKSNTGSAGTRTRSRRFLGFGATTEASEASIQAKQRVQTCVLLWGPLQVRMPDPFKHTFKKTKFTMPRPCAGRLPRLFLSRAQRLESGTCRATRWQRRGPR